MGGIVASKPTINLSEEPLTTLVDPTFPKLLFDHFDKVTDFFNDKIAEVECFEKVVENYSHYYHNIYDIHSFKKKLQKTENVPSHLDICRKVAQGFEDCGKDYYKIYEDLDSILTKIRLLKITLKEYVNSAKVEETNLNYELENANKDVENSKLKETKLTLSVIEAQSENDQPKVDRLQIQLKQANSDTESFEKTFETINNQRKRKLTNILTHLEIMEKKRFIELKELASNFSKVQFDVLEFESHTTETCEKGIDDISEESEIKYFIAKCTKGDINQIKDDVPTPKIQIAQIAYFNKILSDPEDPDKVDLGVWLKNSSDKVKEEIESSKPFTDSEFPPNHNSVVGLQTITKRLDLTWKRATDVYKQLKFGEFSPDNIAPRKGDSWLLSYLYCIAQKPELVSKLFSVNELNTAGIYEVNLCVGGEFTKVIIDDHFPFDKDNVPHFGASKKEELWVPLVVKAFAKAVGCFLKLEANFYYLGFQVLTGYPNYDIIFNDTNSKKPSFLDACWTAVNQAPKKGYLINCFSRFDVDKGLDPSASYIVLDSYSKDDVKLLQLANPWKSTQWNGDWNDSDPMWTEEMKSLIQSFIEKKNTFSSSSAIRK
ncbi:predicted protein [Naegleria gruberi]|uniref:Predicted protein n=1 Tax=Naegleria gruberi TaxID=5762 RepID=D2VGR9_NAEGR|nr:uncharacterized protein NAEGRDRAFT_49404 [Naegleria gruberi]EFC44016.1 predicted protein [Naegleria gruberi]|eukprot:XP_002676760.1 predicted protein [Naegleria gruberi strain NEG-M]